MKFSVYLAAVLALMLAAGCSGLPSMKHCHEVSYTRTGADIRIEAVCRTPVGGGLQL